VWVPCEIIRITAVQLRGVSPAPRDELPVDAQTIVSSGSLRSLPSSASIAGIAIDRLTRLRIAVALGWGNRLGSDLWVTRGDATVSGRYRHTAFHGKGLVISRLSQLA
jgi:hypothetical protein